MESFLSTQRKKILKTMPRIASKIGAILKERICSESKFFPLRAAPMVKKQGILC